MVPAAACLQGTWSAANCSCSCINQHTALNGFCKDPQTGACTVIKQFDLAMQSFYCPQQDSGSGGQASPVPASSAASPAAAPPTASPATAVSSDSLANSSPVPTTSLAGTSPVADVQPLAGVRFSFDVQAQLSSFVGQAEAVCSAVAQLAGEAPGTCTLASVTEATAAAASTRTLTSTSTGGAASISMVQWCMSEAPSHRRIISEHHPSLQATSTLWW